MPENIIPDWVGIERRCYGTGELNPQDVIYEEQFRWINHTTFFIVSRAAFPTVIPNVQAARDEYYARMREYIKKTWISVRGDKSTYF